MVIATTVYTARGILLCERTAVSPHKAPGDRPPNVLRVHGPPRFIAQRIVFFSFRQTVPEVGRFAIIIMDKLQFGTRTRNRWSRDDTEGEMNDLKQI